MLQTSKKYLPEDDEFDQDTLDTGTEDEYYSYDE